MHVTQRHNSAVSRSLTRNVLALAVLAAMLFPPAAALAQSRQSSADGQPAPSQQVSPTATTEPRELKTIMVTGSAIPRTSLETAAPVRVITSAEIQRLGFTTLESALKSLSVDNSGTIGNSFTNGFAAGASGLSLRGLNVSSTLILIDGQRVVDYPTDVNNVQSFVDLNTIPLSAVQRVEVLKDGASSLYGSSAVAGVVNIILKPSFRGATLSAEVEQPQHGGGFGQNVTGMFGTGDLTKDNYNAYLDFSYNQQQPISVSDRDFPFNTNDLSAVGYHDGRAGNPLTLTGSEYGSVAPATLGTPGDLLTGIQVPGTLYQTLRPCGSNSEAVTTEGVGSYCLQNFPGLYGHFQNKLRRDGVHGRVTVKLGPNTTAYLDASYMETYMQFPMIGRIPPQIQSASPVNTDSIALPPVLPDGSLNPNDPFAADGEYALINYAFGGLTGLDRTHNRVYRVVGSLSGTFGDWDYNGALVLSHASLSTLHVGNLAFAPLMSAIENGTYNFVDPDSNSPAVLDAIAPPYRFTATSDVDVLSFSANRFLGSLSGGPIGLAFGSSFRHNAQDQPTSNPNNMYQNQSIYAVRGSRNVASAFGEVELPIWQPLRVDLSARADKYSNLKTTVNPKIGIKFTPWKQLAFRGTYSRGFIAPSFAENSSSTNLSFFHYGIPVDSALYQAHAGNPYVANTYQIGVGSVPNPNLKPERTSSYTLGVVFEPTHWLTGTLDYYNIKITKLINVLPSSVALQAYADGSAIPSGYTILLDTPDPAFPNAPARLVEVQSMYSNSGSQHTDGVDLNLRARIPLSGGWEYDGSLDVTKIFAFDETLGGQRMSFAGTMGPYNVSTGNGTPDVRAQLRSTVTNGTFSATAAVYYTSSLFMSTPDVSGPGCAGGAFGPDGVPVPPNCRMASFTDVDLIGSWKINRTVTITGEVANALDRKPALDVLNFAGPETAYNPSFQQAGIIGRLFKVGVRLAW